MLSFVGIEFTKTVSLGWVICTILVLVVAGFFGIRDRAVKRWRALYDLAVAERKEVQEQLKEALEKLSECTAALNEAKLTIEKLDALQMPIKIVELMNASVERIDRHSQARLDLALQELREAREHESEKDDERHTLLLAALYEVKAALERVALSRD